MPPSKADPFSNAITARLDLADEAATQQLGRALSLTLQAGDTVLLQGDLGAGKSTLARAAIQARLGQDTPVPSPTFTLIQEYETPSLTLCHADLYRIGDEEEIEELGLIEAFEQALCFVEWPVRLGSYMPDKAIAIALTETAQGGRQAVIRLPEGDNRADSLMRAMAREEFTSAGTWGKARIEPLAGDASLRRYFRLHHEGRSAMLMDAPPQTDGSAPTFAKVTRILAERDLSVPALLQTEEESGFLLLEDFGDDLFSALCRDTPEIETTLYEGAVDVLAALESGDAVDMHSVDLPPYDMAVLLREAALLPDWWMVAADAPPKDAARSEYLSLIEEAMTEIAQARGAIVLRDYHADNLIWLAERGGVQRVGLLDYQDALIGHPAYDLVSLLEDARRDVPPALAEALIKRYLAQRPEIDAGAFRDAYDFLGAQRNAKIIGIFARLALRDGKPRYLDMIPRVWAHFMRDLGNSKLAGLRDWVRQNVPEPDTERLETIRKAAQG